MAERPVRLQLSRKKGFNLQALSMATNGLPAVSCARPSKWGNVYVIGGRHPDTGHPVSREESVSLYALYVEPHVEIVRENLAGKNLACWCKIHQHGIAVTCHADVLLSIANDIPMDEVISENIRRATGEEA